jgi:hypothetical protein
MVSFKRRWFKKCQRLIRESKISHWLKGSQAHRWLLALGVFVVLAFVLSPALTLPTRKLEIGSISSRNIKAPRDFFVENKAATLARQEEAANSIRPVYDLDVKTTEVVLDKTVSFFNQVAKIRQKELAPDAKVSRLRERLEVKLAERTLRTLIDHDRFSQVADGTQKLIRETMVKGVVDDSQLLARNIKRGIKLRQEGKAEELRGADVYSIKTASQRIKREAKSIFLEDQLASSAAVEVACLLIEPNLKFNAHETETRKAKARSDAGPVLITIKKNEMIVREGDPVTREHIIKLEALRQYKGKAIVPILGYSLMILIFLLIVIFYLRRYQPDIMAHTSLLLLLGLIVVGMILIIKLVAISPISRYAIPVALATMLIAILLDRNLAILIGIVLATFVAILCGSDLKFGLVAFVGGIVGIFSVRHVRHRMNLTRGGLFVGLANALTILALGLMEGKVGVELAKSSLWGIGNGLTSAIVVTGILPLLENAFRISTDIRLLELSDLNQPILRKLAIEAPGTYHHSVIVGNLAEAAAQKIGANSLLARASSYYHDIGKMEKPQYFIENQITATSKHDKLMPTMSGLIITSHVKSGVEAARKMGLPRIILDIIGQHHGTSLISYFYQQAIVDGGKPQIPKESFRYPGPRPQSKEAAIIMLADSIEAASRTLSARTPGQIKALVDGIVNEKYSDSQLDECNLTMRDLKNITQSFVHTLRGILHARVEYHPEKLDSGGRSGNSDQRPSKEDEGKQNTHKESGKSNIGP